MDTKQFLEYEWEYGNVEIALHVGKYLYGGLYIEMLCREDGNFLLGYKSCSSSNKWSDA